MTTKENIFDIIGQRPLTLSEQQLVKEWCETDSDFAKAVDFQEQFIEALHFQEREKLKSFLKTLEAEQPKHTVKLFTPTLTKWLAVAAAIIAFVAIWQVTFIPQNQKLYAAHFRPFPNVVAPIIRNATSTPDLEIQNAFSAYEQGDYANASVLFNQLAMQSGETYAHFYEAISKMGMGQTKDALNLLLDKSWPSQPFDMKNAADWYIALCLIAEGNQAEALIKLGQIAKNPASPFTNQAKNLIPALER